MRVRPSHVIPAKAGIQLPFRSRNRKRSGIPAFAGMTKDKGRTPGFTLVEMLIALSIFGMITAAGVTLLGLTALTQETSDRLLAELGEIRRVGSLLTADLAQATPRLYRDRDGRPQRAFAGGGGDGSMLMLFVRHGWDRGEGGTVQRVGYRLNEGRLERLGFRNVDGGGTAVPVVLLDGVTALRLRYRDQEGQWRERWDASDATRLPHAVELVTNSETHGMVRQLFLVGTGHR
jgi:general secretion pathway protein J